MPLPKLPTKPATLLDLDTAPLARATRTKPRAAPDALPQAGASKVSVLGASRKAALLQATPVSAQVDNAAMTAASAATAMTPSIAPVVNPARPLDTISQAPIPITSARPADSASSVRP